MQTLLKTIPSCDVDLSTVNWSCWDSVMLLERSSARWLRKFSFVGEPYGQCFDASWKGAAVRKKKKVIVIGRKMSI